MKGRRPRPLDDGDSGRARVSGQFRRAKPLKNRRDFYLPSSATITPMSIVSQYTATMVKTAAESLLEGNLVAFPTETVYGLGADATNQRAVRRIYTVKGRPLDHPVIVHISSIESMNKWAQDIPNYAATLARTFWPGPMTLILPRTNLAKNFITGGQENVGIRIPSHPLALELLSAFESKGGIGIAAPSANRFGAVSPTTAHAVEIELNSHLSAKDKILDGGACQIGVESTIINCTQSKPAILRPGAITLEMIESYLNISIEVSASITPVDQIKASGLHESHYAPKAKVILIGSPSPGDGFIALDKFFTPEKVFRLAAPKSNEEYAQILYQAFRLADKLGLDRVFVKPPSGKGIAVAINDRLAKAASHS